MRLSELAGALGCALEGDGSVEIRGLRELVKKLGGGSHF